jgi:type II secretory pathway component GspD/PulD (secretin)
MIQPNPKQFALILLILLFLWDATQAIAQQQRTTQQRTTTGAGRVGTGGYPSSTQIGEAIISSDPETRQLIIIADEDTNLQIRQIIANLDRPKPQVRIEVVFMEVTHRNALDFGLQGNYTYRSGSTVATAGTVFGGPATGAFASMVNDDIELTLRALAEAGKTEILSRPSIMARNNQQAVIILGQEVPLITNVRFTELGGQQNTVQYRDVGIILRVTPFITNDGLVEMIVAPEISALTDRTVPLSEGVSAPVIAKRAAETVVVTPHGKTVVIGGLMENNKTQSDRKVPVLGDIPLLGNLFKRRIKDDTKTELLIFLTPYIVQNPMDLPRASDIETGRMDLAPKAFSERDFERYFDGSPFERRDVQDSPRNNRGLIRDAQ